jgi:hypothetical protein
MLRNVLQWVFIRLASTAMIAAALFTAWLPSVVNARVTQIIVDTKVSPAFNGQSFGAAGQYETLSGRAFGEIDPNDPHNAIIQDINLAPRNARGHVEYMASFFLVKPIDMSKSSHLMLHGVPNRGGRINIGGQTTGDVGLSSGWQGDITPTGSNDGVVVPVAVNPDGSPVTGPVMVRLWNKTGNTQQMTDPLGGINRYPPLTLDTTQAKLVSKASETTTGVASGVVTIPSTDWAFANCASTPFPGTPDPTRLCLKNGFDPTLLYEIVFTGQNALVLGVGSAAFRDVASFFRYSMQDDFGTPNPVANGISWIITQGASQSGNYIKNLILLGFTADEAGRKVWDGAWPTLTSKHTTVNVRFATPGGGSMVYELGMEPPQWWVPWPDPARGRPTVGMLDRCTVSATCPKIFETFGGTEFWGLKTSASLVGTSANTDIPLPSNVRRYYYPGTNHGGGGGGFSTATPAPPTAGTGVGVCVLPANPNPQTQTVNALMFALRNWVMNNTPPPPSQYPSIANGILVPPTKSAMGFPTIPGIPFSDNFANPLLDYDLGPNFVYTDLTGVVAPKPPGIKQVLPQLVPRVNADGNELGGVPSVLFQAPLGTYLGWNIVATGFFKGDYCGFTGGYLPFAESKAQRVANGDPRLSLEERYGSHNAYVLAVESAAKQAYLQGFLLQSDMLTLVNQVRASNVCTHGSSGQSCDPAAP